MMQNVITRFVDLLIVIRKSLNRNQFNIIAIDGYCGQGKTSLAKKLALNLEIQCIELDTTNYLHRNQGGYINWIKYDHLKKELEKLRKDKKNIIVEGICILEVLKNIDLTPSIHIYTKKLIGEKWPKDKYLDYSKNLNDVISAEEEEINGFSNWLNSDEESGENNFIDEIDINEMSSKIDESTLLNKNDKVRDFDGIHRELLEYHFKYKPNEIAQIVFAWEKT